MGQASARKASRRELREATGTDIVGLIDSHADSITDLLKALHHEVHMRVQHVQMIKSDLDAAVGRIAALEARCAKWEVPQ